jgi:beta-phosphoglucomutase-like phosphatase (HAD superfamily)
VHGLPDDITSCLFDLDGVLTQTAKIHAAAWKQTFDQYLRKRSQEQGEKFVPFDKADDYDQYVDGKPRYDSVRSFLESRGIKLSEGDKHDTDGAETIHGIGDRKNVIVLGMIEHDGVEAYDGSVRFAKAAKDAPDTFLAGAKALGVEPAQAAVFEDALVGVQAGRAGGFGFVVGVDRVGQANALKAHGADVVVEDLAELLAAS